MGTILPDMFLAEARAKRIANGRALAKALEAYLQAVERGNDYPDETLPMCNAAIAFADDGDFMNWRDWFCEERGWDNDGCPIGEYGEQLDNPVRVVHPDGSWNWKEV